MSRKRVFRYESKNEPLLSPKLFLRRLFWNFALASLVVVLSLLGGMMGYHFIEGLNLLDSFLNAAMLLSGMGPVDQLKTTAGKLFAGCYALYSGLILVLSSGIILAPLVHRMLHRFHLENDSQS